MIFLRDNIVFEYDALAHAHTVSQDSVVDELVLLVNRFISELGIIRLDKIVVKETNFFETELGLANYDNYTIVLANHIAYRLADRNNRYYQSALAVLQHELYHFLDYQNLRLNCVRKNIPTFNTIVLNDFKCWTEFFASFSTFNVCEDENLYASFRAIYEKIYTTDKEKKYYACRLFGYFLHAGHSEKCDELVNKYLLLSAIDETINSFKSVLQSYPIFSAEQLRNIGLAIEKVITTQKTSPIYTPVSKKDFWERMLSKSKDTM